MRNLLMIALLVCLCPTPGQSAAPPDRQSSEAAREKAAQLQKRDDLLRQAQELRDKGKYREAIAPATRALEQTRALRGADHAEAVAGLSGVTELSELAGEVEQAVKYRQAVLTATEKQRGVMPWQTTDARLALQFARKLASLEKAGQAELIAALREEQQALRLEKQGKQAEAERVMNGVLAVYRKRAGTESVEVSRALQLRGRLRWSQDKNEAAKDDIQAALGIRRKMLPAAHPDIAQSLSGLGIVQHDLREYAAARKSYEEALAIRRKALPKNHSKIADSLNNLGLVQHDLQEYEAVRKSHEEALAIYRKTRPKDHPDIADSLNNIGNAQYALRDYEGARKSYQDALAIRRNVFPKNLSDIANSLNHLGNAQHNLREHEAARKSHEEALAIRHKVLPKDHVAIAQSLHNLGNAQYALRDHEAARKSYEEALAIHRKALPKDHPDIADCLNNLGLVQRDLREYAAARKSHEEALTIYRKAKPKDHPNIAMSLHNLGWVQHGLREYAAARKSYEDALAIYRKVWPKDHPDIALGLNNLGLVQRVLREYEAARKSHEEALAIYRKAWPKDHPDIARSLNNLGLLQRDLREYAAARKSHQEALAIRRKALPKDHPAIAMSLHNLGMVQHDLREYEAARKSYEDALAIKRKVLPKDHPDIARSLNNLGLVQRDLREYAAARKSHQQALAIRRKALPKDHPDIATSLHNLGMVQRVLREYEAAQKSYEDALAIYRKAWPKDHPDIALSLNNLGNVQRNLQDYQAARMSHEEALAIYRMALPKDHPDIAMSLHSLGSLQSDLREYEAGRKSHEEALAIYRKTLSKDHPYIAKILNDLGSLSLRTGKDLPQALKELKEAVRIKQRDLSRLALAQAETEQLLASTDERSTLDLLLSLAAEEKGESLEDIYSLVVAFKGAVTTRQRWARQLRDQTDPTTRKLLDQLDQVNQALLRSAFTKQSALSGESGRLRDLSAEVQTLSIKRGRLEQQLAVANPAFRLQMQRAARGATDLRAALPVDAALIDIIEYIHYSSAPKEKSGLTYERRLLAFVVRPGKTKVTLVPLGPAEPIATAIDRWRLHHGGKRSDNDAALLRRKLWIPLEPHVRSAKIVLLSPDGAITRLAWPALPGEKPGTYLIEEKAIAVLPIPQLLPELLVARPRREQPSLLLVGNVAFGADKRIATPRKSDRLPPMPYFPDLPGTSKEVADLQRQFSAAFPKAPTPNLLSKDKGTKSAFLAAAPNARFVHLATHGYFAPPSERSALHPASRSGLLREAWMRLEAAGRHPGLLSGVVFAGANDPRVRPEEAVLTALEASELGLEKVELLTLSACETARGKGADGEGVLGLQRAFQVSGAGTVVASLWQVPDRATQVLMSRFHANLWGGKKGMSKLESLREAQIWMLRQGRKDKDIWRGSLTRLEDESVKGGDTLPPYYWAAFVLSGDWR